VAAPEPTSAGRCGPKLQCTCQHVDTRLDRCLNLELVYGISGLQDAQSGVEMMTREKERGVVVMVGKATTDRIKWCVSHSTCVNDHNSYATSWVVGKP
jgi:hypothetical protein